ncbi:BREX-2 system adenine-specific DNA-methyltransferase PglX [Azohydromonas australica]|uniref:BREX-2 system adenine-specific DNA-methyltransferase PglX n=1 Tax=Azohydromonas australica TaxID=364039 RepID=UPI000429C64F|nr:BREX-2 system adenine-specific DNA-methyltransferase PglX [Azohydromonas australica]
MIDAKALLAALTRQLKRLEDDLRQRIDEVVDLNDALRAEWQAAHDADRTAETFESWAEQVITQAGVHWLLSCVFLRFVEDNVLVERPWLGGRPDDGRLALARDRHETFFRAHPELNDRDYLLAAFREAGELPGLHTFFDEAHNPVFRLGISGDAAMALLQFWQQVDPDTGKLIFNFEDVELDTRFLGDLYQDLSEATRKRYALLQTPEFVEEFILDRTLTPALREFGLRVVRLIDPTCGSGHFLLGAFHRLVDEWACNEPGLNRREVAKRALDAVAGVDLNPFAVAIARFRLLVAALKVSDVQRLRDAPDFKLHVAIGDSLLHGRRFGLKATDDMFTGAEHYAGTGLAHAYASEDLKEVQDILGHQYHAVVGNPPYIVVKDAALNAAYRRDYPESCHMKYSLGAPFTQRFFELATTGKVGQGAGFVGLITANSFMKREFGAKLIEKVLPQLDLTHVVDTSGAYIPGHGTPTVILFGRHRTPVDTSVRAVMGIKGEPSTPENPEKGLVWNAILNQIDRPDSQSAFLSVADTPRITFSKHPWSIGGGGASELKEAIEARSAETFGSKTTAMGFFGISAADEVMLADLASFARRGVEQDRVRPLISGDEVRDWAATPELYALFPYDKDRLVPINSFSGMHRWLWPTKAYLGARVTFSKRTYLEEGRAWWEWHQIALDRIKSPLTITFAEVASHNHFILERGGKVFNRTAPIIKLPTNASEEEHLGLLGVLNSSVACFWMKQVSHQKQMMGGDGIRISDKSKVPYQFASTQLKELPLPANWQNSPLRQRLVTLARQADELGRQLASPSVEEIIRQGLASGTSIVKAWSEIEQRRSKCRSQLIFLQEEIDFTCYSFYELTNEPNLHSERCDWEVSIDAGSRPFCILAQKNDEGFSVPADVPSEWPEELQALWRRRMEAIRASASLKAIEESHYKRRWVGRQGLFNHDKRRDEFRLGLRTWLLTHLEQPHYWPTDPPQLASTAKLADAAQRDTAFMQVAALYAGHADFDVGQLVAELAASEAVPYLPVLRYADSGQRKRAQWEATWALQRQEDAIDAEVEAEAEGWRKQLQSEARETWGSHEHPDAVKWLENRLAEELANQKAERKANEVGKIPVPPKYQSKDFLKADFWRLRGGLDVPKERWISYPGAERGADGSLPVAWAGWDHLQQATALAGYYLDMKDSEGWPAERLQPLLAGLLELVPWLQQWHNDVHPEFGERMGDYYASFVADEARGLGCTLDDLRAWKPAVVATKRGRKAKAST